MYENKLVYHNCCEVNEKAIEFILKEIRDKYCFEEEDITLIKRKSINSIVREYGFTVENDLEYSASITFQSDTVIMESDCPVSTIELYNLIGSALGVYDAIESADLSAKLSK